MYVKSIDDLVRDAQAGDHFFFYYSGHSGQVTNRHNSEEDGKDEVIITCDYKELVDNVSFPYYILFFSDNDVPFLCRSFAGILLIHFLLARISWPSLTRAILAPCWTSSIIAVIEFGLLTSRRDAGEQILAEIVLSGILPWVCFAAILQSLWLTRVVDVEMDFHLGSHGLTFFTEQSVLIRALSIDSPKPSPNLRNQPLPGESRSSLPSKIDLEISIPAPFFPIMMRCDSPTPVWECDGYCRDRQQLHAAERANIICISACTDAQETWESPDGSSLTMVLVSILKDNPRPTLQELMQRLNFRAHDQARELHGATVQWKKERKAFRKGRPTSTKSREEISGEKDNFWDPQMASLTPLDMSACLPL
ncbi:hypothetical protein HWV62_32991 [Athelia sp. TMB]|nr:hypothetical protein HWV62_32991 [Athelia sp. TMB]